MLRWIDYDIDVRVRHFVVLFESLDRHRFSFLIVYFLVDFIFLELEIFAPCVDKDVPQSLAYFVLEFGFVLRISVIKF